MVASLLAVPTSALAVDPPEPEVAAEVTSSADREADVSLAPPPADHMAPAPPDDSPPPPDVLADPPPSRSGATLAAEGGSIAGTVVADAGGAPLAGICANIFPAGGGNGIAASSPSAADGTYLVSGLAAGSYKVRFQDCVSPFDYAAEYFDNTLSFNTATSVPVTVGATTAGINAGLAIGGGISGMVVADGSGTALAGICVSATNVSTNSSLFRPTTPASGLYTIFGLAAGTYRVRFEDCVSPTEYATEFFDNKPDSASATTVVVSAGATTSGINAGLAPGGSISGTVVANGTGAPLAGICANAYLPSGVFGGGSPPSAADGTYLISGVAVGGHKVRFHDCVAPNDYAIEYFDDKPDFGAASTVTVAAGTTTAGINAGLGIGGRISGTVVADATGAPVPGICVYPFNATSGWSVTSTTTAADGTYTLAGLPPATYRVRFQDCVSPVDYATEYYDNKPNNSSSANLVTVTAGATTAGINAGLAAGGSISGTVVVAPTGNPLAGICVYVYPPTGGNSVAASAPTGPNGTYVVAGIAMGTYKVRFQDCDGFVDYVIEFYDDKLDLNAGTPVPVTAGATTPGINAVLAVGGRISGTVVADGSGAPLSGICVTAHPLSTGNSLVRVVTGADGAFLVGGLATASYKVRFEDCVIPIDYATEHYANKVDYGAADPVSVTAGATTAGINAGLAAAGSVSGTVVAEGSGAPLAGICASLFPTTGGSSVGASAPSAANGTYVIQRVAVGTYKVKFQDCVAPFDYAAEYYDNTLNFSAASPVPVSASATTPGVNAALAIGGTIAGTVVADGSGAPLPGICVTPSYASTGSGLFRSTTGNDGTYSVSGLAAGTYKVKFEDCVGPVDYVTEYFDNKPDYPGANTVPVTAGATTSPINASMAGAAQGRYTPLTPARILDTRNGTGGFGALAPGATVEVQITGRGGVPASGVSAVAMNVTVTQPTATGFLTLFPTGAARPLAANLNFTPAKTVPNLVVAKVGTGGKVSLYNSAGTSHVIFDVAGWFSSTGSGNDGRYASLFPARILDTRSGVPLAPGASMDLQVSGQGGVPAAGAKAAVLNVAVTGPTATSFLTVFPAGAARPLAANLNFNGGDTVSNRVMATLGTAGKVTIYNNAGSTHVIVDVGGWYSDATVAGTTGTYAPLEPARILDTRPPGTGFLGPLAANTTVAVQVTGRGGVPTTGVSAVILNATVVQPAAGGFLTISPTGTARPLASDLNYAAGETRANLVVVRVGAGGRVDLYTSAGSHVVFDVAGWFS